MKNLVSLILLIYVAWLPMFSFAQDTNEVSTTGRLDTRDLMIGIQSHLLDTNWIASWDKMSVTLIKRNAKFINPANLPLIYDSLPADVQADFVYTNDMRITITLGPCVSKEEYARILQLQRDMAFQRVNAFTNLDKVDNDVICKKIIQLPVFYTTRTSIYLYLSNNGETSDEDVKTVCVGITNALRRLCYEYDVGNSK